MVAFFGSIALLLVFLFGAHIGQQMGYSSGIADILSGKVKYHQVQVNKWEEVRER